MRESVSQRQGMMRVVADGGRGLLLLAFASLAAGAAGQAGVQIPPPLPTPLPTPAAADAPASGSTLIRIDLDATYSGAAGPFAYDPLVTPPFDVVPPLSVYESRLMLSNARRELRETTAETLAARAMRIDFMLESVARYIRWVDETHTTLPYYRWTDLTNVKLHNSEWRTLVLRPAQPLEEVSAIALRVHNGDVLIEELSAIDVDGLEWRFTKQMHLRADQPRSEVCFLAMPVRLVELRVRVRQAVASEVNVPRLYLQTGVCSRPETAKRSVYHIQRARHELRSGRIAEAAAQVELAEKFLYEYQQDRRL